MAEGDLHSTSPKLGTTSARTAPTSVLVPSPETRAGRPEKKAHFLEASRNSVQVPVRIDLAALGTCDKCQALNSAEANTLSPAHSRLHGRWERLGGTPARSPLLPHGGACPGVTQTRARGSPASGEEAARE